VKKGIIDKIIDENQVLVKDLFKKDTNINLFLNKTVIMALTGNQGYIQSSFGNSGKIKVIFPQGIYYIPKKSIQQEKESQNQKNEQ